MANVTPEYRPRHALGLAGTSRVSDAEADPNSDSDSALQCGDAAGGWVLLDATTLEVLACGDGPAPVGPAP